MTSSAPSTTKPASAIMARSAAPGAPSEVEVIAEKNGIRDVQAQRLQTAQVHFPAPGDPHFDVGENETEHGQGPQAFRRAQFQVPGQGGAFEGHQEIDGDRVGPSSCRPKATSTSSSSDSPMPTITPEHGESPAPAAWRTVPTLSSKECVLHMLP